MDFIFMGSVVTDTHVRFVFLVGAKSVVKFHYANLGVEIKPRFERAVRTESGVGPVRGFRRTGVPAP